MNKRFLTGRVSPSENTVIVEDENLNCFLHKEVVGPLQQFQKSANSAGYCLQVASAYRDFDRQLTIWNEKVSGKRPVLDAFGGRLNTEDLSEWELVQAILGWSALPGASRHHWGTDLDVFDPQCLPQNYQLQLTLDEYETGVLSEFNQWLGGAIKSAKSPFYRPYYSTQDGRSWCGVAPEPWHISYRPLAKDFAHSLTVEVLEEALSQADLLLKTCVWDHLDEIYDRYVQVDLDR